LFINHSSSVFSENFRPQKRGVYWLGGKSECGFLIVPWLLS